MGYCSAYKTSTHNNDDDDDDDDNDNDDDEEEEEPPPCLWSDCHKQFFGFAHACRIGLKLMRVLAAHLESVIAPHIWGPHGRDVLL